MTKKPSKRLLLSTERIQDLQPHRLAQVTGGGHAVNCDLSIDPNCVTSKTPVGGSGY